MDRRHFLKGAAAGLAVAVGAEAAEPQGKPLARRKLGRTGEDLSIIGFGGIVVVGMEQARADKIVAESFDRGVNYYDVAPSYGKGEAEEKLGPALKPYRDRVFLACKTQERFKAGAERELNESLKRLKTDHFDLYQLHALSKREDVEAALGPEGAMETFRQAREQGKIRFIGFSAHSVETALLAMERFSFDTILFPFNWVCYACGNFGPQVLEAARKKEMGCLALKALARTPWPKGVRREYGKCWYRPVTDPEESALALRFTLSEAVTAAVPPGDERLFRRALEVASEFQPLTDEERKGLLAKAKAEILEPIFRYKPA